MISRATAFLRGVFSSALLISNTFFWFVPILLMGILRFLLPFAFVQRLLARPLVWCAERWVLVNSMMLDTLLSIEWEISGLDNLSSKEWYLVAANHQAWVDIPVLQYVFAGRIPFLKFFIKKQLVWVPMLGIAWWALDMPFMERYSKAQLQARPELKGRDMETTRKACEKFRHQPTSVINFLEGTRFTKSKHAQRKSRFRHLLSPRAGGIAFAISALGKQFHSLLDVTIVYPDIEPSFWALLSGRIRRIVVHVRKLEIPAELLAGDYREDREYRQKFQAWVTGMWKDKDQLIDEIRA